MKNNNICALGVSLLMISLMACSGGSTKAIELTQEQKDSIERVKNDSINRATEQQRINDSIQHVKDSIQAIQARKDHIERIERLLKECEVNCFDDIASFNDNRRSIEWAISSEEDEKLKRKWSSALKSVQVRNFPKARKYYIQKTKNEMWVNDVEVYGSGTTITFVSYIFASNSNIQEGYSAVKPALEALRFKRVNFKWAEYNEYTYYTLDTPSDGTIEL